MEGTLPPLISVTSAISSLQHLSRDSFYEKLWLKNLTSLKLKLMNSHLSYMPIECKFEDLEEV